MMDKRKIYDAVKAATVAVILESGAKRPSVIDAFAKTNADVAVYKLAKHNAFPGGFPTIPIASYESIFEMMEVGVCGFPLGDSLFEQIGTASSSFTTGRLSSIIPLPGVPRDDVKGFQLDVIATHGNSGGPVFTLDTGEVFGVLQGGVFHPLNDKVPFGGLAKAEPVWRALEHDAVARLVEGENPARGG